MTELSLMLISGKLGEGASVTIGVDASGQALKYDIEPATADSERNGKKPRTASEADTPIIEELDDDYEDLMEA